MKARFVFGLAVWSCATAVAQLAPPNQAGVTMGHVHLYVRNLAAQNHFWIDIMGGRAVMNEKLAMIEFPGVYIVLREKEPTGPPSGSVVDHIGFAVRDMPGAIAKWKANGLMFQQSVRNPRQAFVQAPDDIRVEVVGEPELAVPIQMNHVHMFAPKTDVAVMQAWYANVFGGVVGKRESVARPGTWIDCDDFPGTNLSISVSDTARAPSAGRSIDHIGFEIKDLESFAKKIQSQGVKLDVPIRENSSSKRIKSTVITDPWGTRIELTEGLTP